MFNAIKNLIRKGDYQGSGRQDDGCGLIFVVALGAAITIGTEVVKHL